MLCRSTVGRDLNGDRIWRALKEGEEFFKYTFFEDVENIKETCRQAIMKESCEVVDEGDCLFRITHFIGTLASGLPLSFSCHFFRFEIDII